jgi:hypothetical protein
MGLDLCCGSVSIRVGSYTSVHRVRNFLIESLIRYLEITSEGKSTDNVYDLVDFNAKKDLLSLLKRVIINGEIDYNYLSEITPELSLLNLNGFTCFINHSDCDGMIDSFDASEFIKTLNIVENYMNKEVYFEDNQFYLKNIFIESSETGDDIVFC